MAKPQNNVVFNGLSGKTGSVHQEKCFNKATIREYRTYTEAVKRQ